MWRFVTNHAHVLACIAADPTLRLRDIAAIVGITERSAANIVTDLEEAGYPHENAGRTPEPVRASRRAPLRHPRHRHHTVGELIRFLQAPAPKAPSHS